MSSRGTERRRGTWRSSTRSRGGRGRRGRAGTTGRLPATHARRPGLSGRRRRDPREMMVTSDTRIAVIGQGYVGLPLAIAFVEAGLDVIGVDRSASRVAELLAGRSPIDDIEDERLCAALDRGLSDRRGGRRRRRPGRGRRPVRLRPDADHRVEGPRSRARPEAAGLIAAQPPRRPARRSSSRRPSRAPPPGRSARSSKRAACVAGRDFDLAFAPERVNPGDPAQRLAGCAPARRRHDARSDGHGPRPSCATSTTTCSSSARPTRPRWPSSSRTSSAT